MDTQTPKTHIPPSSTSSHSSSSSYRAHSTPPHSRALQGSEDEAGSVGRLGVTCISLAETQCSKTSADKHNSSDSTLHKPRTALALLGTLGWQVLAWGVREERVIFFIPSLAYFELATVEALGGCGAGSRLGADIGGL